MTIAGGRAAYPWMDYARRSMQRVGFLKWAIGLASAARPQTLESLSRAFSASVTRLEAVPATFKDELESYVRRQRIKRKIDPSGTAEIQDIYLADRALPSHTGAITGDLEQKGYRHSVYVDIPTWAVKLQLLRSENYTLTDRGRVLLLSQPPAQSQSGIGANPLLLSLSEKYVALFCILDADGELLRRMYRRLLHQPKFSRSEAGSAAGEALKEICSELRGADGPTRQFRARAERAIRALENQKGDKSGPRESIATPRTEPLVDCGILEKPDPATYDYKVTPWGATFLSDLIVAPSVRQFLDSKFTSAVSKSAARLVTDREVAISFVAPAYDMLKTGLGYVALRELALASVALSLSREGGPGHELGDIEAAVRRAAGNRLARIAKGRIPGSAQVRLDLRAMKSDGV